MKNSVRFSRELKRAGLIAGALAVLLSSAAAVRAEVLSAVNHTSSPATHRRLAAAMPELIDRAALPGKTGVNFCACCADQGAWYQSSQEISELERGKGDSVAEIKEYWGEVSIDKIYARIMQ